MNYTLFNFVLGEAAIAMPAAVFIMGIYIAKLLK
jgi:hypothetical protein